MTTGILIHGCHLHVAEWIHVAWGSPQSGLGRIPAGLLQAVKSDASVVVMGTGASFKPFSHPDSLLSGKRLSEAEYSFEFLHIHADQLRDFPDWQRAGLQSLSSNQWQAFRTRLLERIHLDNDSTNTVSEVTNAARVFINSGVDQVIIVTSPTHLVRATRDALAVFSSHPEFAGFCGNFMAFASATDFRNSSPDDVLVLEPPHRLDRAGVDCRAHVRRLMALRSLEPRLYAALLEDLHLLLEQHEIPQLAEKFIPQLSEAESRGVLEIRSENSGQQSRW